MPHPDEGLIHAWLDGELDAAEAARVEALVARDAEWTAAAAEARGLIAASSRIVGALDHVNANVIPKAPAVRRAPRWWMARIAALVVVVAGTTVVLRQNDAGRALRETVPLRQPESTSRAGALNAPAPAAAVLGAAPPVTPVLAAPKDTSPKDAALRGAALRGAALRGAALRGAALRGAALRDAAPKASLPKLATSRPAAPEQKLGTLGSVSGQPAATADSLTATIRARSLRVEPQAATQGVIAGGVAAERQKAEANVSAPPAAAAPKAQALDRADSRLALTAKGAGSRAAANMLCFDVRSDSIRAGRVWKLDSAQVADSVRLLKLSAQGDTLRAAATGLLAVKIRCPEP